MSVGQTIHQSCARRAHIQDVQRVAVIRAKSSEQDTLLVGSRGEDLSLVRRQIREDERLYQLKLDC